MTSDIRVKICGLTTVDDALRCVSLGADALGLNFWPGSPRRVDVQTARHIVEALGDRVDTVGVFVDFELPQIRRIRDGQLGDVHLVRGDLPP